MKRKKGVTLLEMLIVLALVVVVLGTVFPFFSTNTKSLNETEIKSQLQQEGQDILNSITQKSMEGQKISEINKVDGTSVLDITSCDISKITLLLLDGSESITYTLNSSNKTFTDLTSSNVLSTNVKSINVSSIDGKLLGECEGIKIVMNLSKKYSGKEITYSISTNIRFRNHDATT